MMDYITKSVLGIHVLAGTISLVLFWIPALSKKGNTTHRKVGIWYMYCMGMVVITAFMLCVVNVIEGDIISAIFLGFLCLLTGNPLWYGVAILKNKNSISREYLSLHRILNVAIIGYGAFLIFYGLYIAEGIKFLFLFFGALGLTGIFELRQNKQAIKERGWLRIHYVGMISSGIAAYTAFFAFGGRQMFAELLPGNWQLVPWVAPSVIGFMSIKILNNYYRAKKIIA